MIPKIIHYCWFGNNPLPKMAKECIDSWKKFFPEYEIIEWNETNFDIAVNDYVKEAYRCKRFAFVSDYARFWILYNYGGLYFDTDVKVIKSMDDIIERGAFMGFETPIASGIPLYVAPGLGMGCPKESPLIKDFIDIYDDLHFIGSDGSQNLITIVQLINGILLDNGLKASTQIQRVKDFYIYPKDFFNPYDAVSDKYVVTENTRSIHYFAASWKTSKEKFMESIKRIFGDRGVDFIHCIYSHTFKKLKNTNIT